MITLTLCRPWYLRLLDALTEWRGEALREPAGRDSLLNLGQHLLTDIGLDAGMDEGLGADERRRAQVVRLHSLGGF